MTTAVDRSDKTTNWRSVNLDVLRRIEELPSLSSVVTEFLALTRRECFTARDFEKVLCKDQALVARLLKIANSALYGKPRGIHAIGEAVVLVGLETMKRIVLTVSTEGYTRQRLRNYDYEAERGYWLHSTAVGLAARAIVNAMPDKPLHGEEAFVAGLLHDVGKLIVDDFLDAADGPRHVTLAEETEAVGLDHAELAEYILQQWHLPDNIVAAVRDHHAPIEQTDADLGARLIQLAHVMIGTWQVGQIAPLDLACDFDPEPHADLIAAVGLPTSKLDQVIWDIRQQLADVDKLDADC